MSFFLEVVQSAFSPMVLFYMFAGVAAGICIGALPGLTATMGVALLLPLTFGMDATSGILMLLGIYVGAIYGGSISAILLHTPGTPASAATAIDGYQFSKRGEAGRAQGPRLHDLPWNVCGKHHHGTPRILLHPPFHKGIKRSEDDPYTGHFHPLRRRKLRDEKQLLRCGNDVDCRRDRLAHG